MAPSCMARMSACSGNGTSLCPLAHAATPCVSVVYRRQWKSSACLVLGAADAVLAAEAVVALVV